MKKLFDDTLSPFLAQAVTAEVKTGCGEQSFVYLLYASRLPTR